MTISDETAKRMRDRWKEMEARIPEVMAIFRCSEDTAKAMLQQNDAWKAIETAEKLDKRTGRAISALFNTFRNTSVDSDK